MGKIVVLCFVCLILCAFFLVPSVVKSQEKKIQSLTEEISKLEEEIIPARFKITEKTTDSLSVELKFYDLDGSEVSSARYENISGKELSLDFQIIKFSENSFLCFPYKIFTDFIAPSDGYSLMKLYSDGSAFPLIYKTKSESNSSFFYEVYNDLLNNEQKDKFQYGSAVHDLEYVTSFKKGFIYKIVFHPHSGGIEIVRE